MSWKGDLLKAGISSNGHDVEIFNGDFSVVGDLSVAGDLAIAGAISFSGGVDFDTEVDIAFTDADGGAIGLHVALTFTEVEAIATRGVLGHITYSPDEDPGTACPIGVEGRVDLDGNLTYVNCYPGYGWGVQGRIHVVTGTTINGTVSDPGAIYVGVRGVITDDGTSTYTKGTLACFYADMQLSQDAGAEANFNVYLAWLRNQGSATATTVDAALYIDAGNAWGGDSITIGVDINDCTTGIDIGDATDGIIISGAMSDNGIEISGVCGGNAILITSTTAIASLIDLYVDATYTNTTIYEWHTAGRFDFTYTPATGTGSSMGSALVGIMDIDATTVLNGPTWLQGISGRLYITAATELNYGTGVCCALHGELLARTSATLSGGHICVLDLVCNTQVDFAGMDINTYIFFDNDAGHANGGLESVMHLRVWDTDFLLDMPSSSNPGMLTLTGSGGNTRSGRIKCRIDSTDHYISLYTD